MGEEIIKLKERVFRHPKAQTLNMERVPQDTLDVFKKFANDQFVGDYGMALKKLVDMVIVEPLPFEQIHAVLENHELRIAKLESGEPKKVKEIKTLSGRRIKNRMEVE